MPKYQNILVAVDFSEHTDAVIQAALAQAEDNEVKLTVLNVVDYSRPVDDDYILPPEDEVQEQLVNAARERLEKHLKLGEVELAERLVVVGRPKQEILRIAEREKVDLIVLGAHGHHGLAGLLGSTTDRIVHRAECDVLIAR